MAGNGAVVSVIVGTANEILVRVCGTLPGGFNVNQEEPCLRSDGQYIFCAQLTNGR